MLKLEVRGDGFARMSEAIEVLGDKRAKTTYRMAINQAGRDTKVATGRALAKQTGLKVGVTRRALKEYKATTEGLEYVLKGGGGDISLKHFGARETRRGVSAAPFGRRDIYASTFMKAGWFSTGRVIKPNWNGQVFSRLGRKTGKGTDAFHKERSGVIIPVEMVKGVTAETFRVVGLQKLEAKIFHHIKRATKGLVS